MPKWEYTVKESYQVPLEAHLNEMGKEGWELVTTMPYLNSIRLIFKRQYIEDQMRDKMI